MTQSITEDRVIGCLFGLAVGDALGTTLEFKRPGSFTPLADMVGGGAFRLQKGQWTDDTSMALCLAESLIEQGKFDAFDQMERYLKWWRHGHLSSTGECFDIGNTTSHALAEFERSGQPFSGSVDPHAAGNGCLMRLAPIPMFYACRPDLALHYSAESARTTHGADNCLAASRYFGGLLVGAMLGDSKEELLAPRYCPPGGTMDWETVTPDILVVANGSFWHREPPEIRGIGYVVKSLEAALWAFSRSESFEEGALRAVNLGDDADTTGAIYGQIAGAYYGLSGIPQKWIAPLAMRSRITELAEGCSNTNSRINSPSRIRAVQRLKLDQSSTGCFRSP